MTTLREQIQLEEENKALLGHILPRPLQECSFSSTQYPLTAFRIVLECYRKNGHHPVRRPLHRKSYIIRIWLLIRPTFRFLGELFLTLQPLVPFPTYHPNRYQALRMEYAPAFGVFLFPDARAFLLSRKSRIIPITQVTPSGVSSLVRGLHRFGRSMRHFGAKSKHAARFPPAEPCTVVPSTSRPLGDPDLFL